MWCWVCEQRKAPTTTSILHITCYRGCSERNRIPYVPFNDHFHMICFASVLNGIILKLFNSISNVIEWLCVCKCVVSSAYIEYSCRVQQWKWNTIQLENANKKKMPIFTVPLHLCPLKLSQSFEYNLLFWRLEETMVLNVFFSSRVEWNVIHASASSLGLSTSTFLSCSVQYTICQRKTVNSFFSY